MATNKAISNLVLTEAERNLAEQLVDSYARGGTVGELCRKAIALSKAVEDGTVLFTGDRLSSRIVIELPIEGDAQ